MAANVHRELEDQLLMFPFGAAWFEVSNLPEGQSWGGRAVGVEYSIPYEQAKLTLASAVLKVGRSE